MSLSIGLIIFVLLSSLSRHLRERKKWAFWVALIGSGLLLLRYIIGVLAQLSTWLGLAIEVTFMPLTLMIYLITGGLCALILTALLSSRTRILFFAPREFVPQAAPNSAPITAPLADPNAEP